MPRSAGILPAACDCWKAQIPVHGGVIGQPHVRGHRAQEHVIIG